jgi:cyclopropane-fatty-acyl-phospholipid synthase
MALVQNDVRRCDVRGKSSPVQRWLINKFLARLQIPLRVVLAEGEVLTSGPGEPVATLRLLDPRVHWQILAHADLGFGDAYSDGRIEIEGDLVEFLDRLFRTQAAGKGPDGLLAHPLLRWLTRPRSTALAAARQNIHHHYDVGNDFYRLWLDERMVYTCAYFADADLSLEDAQLAKMDHVCRKLRLRRGQRVIEAGCGWGALALHMAQHYGVTVTAYNISHAQIDYARARAKAEGLDSQVQFVEDDYRNITGRCDAFVSVGMLEHVGRDRYRDFGAVIRRCLEPAGLGLIHSIGRSVPAPTSPWLEKRIFPGAYMPSLGEMMAVFEPWGFSVLDVENLRLHYARTLAHWLQRFEASADQVRARFDEQFLRAWRLYLASSQAGFTSGHIQLFQAVFAHSTNNEIPWSRADVYRNELAAPDPNGKPEGARRNGAL